MSTATAKKTPTTAAAAATTEVKISDHVKTLAGIFASHMKGDKDGNIVVDADAIEANLPDDLNMATIRRVQKHRGEVVAAASLALAEVGLPIMKKDKEVAKVFTHLKIGNDRVDLAIDREREFNDGKGGKLLKQGYLSVSYTATGATNAGEFKKARQHIANEATALFG